MEFLSIPSETLWLFFAASVALGCSPGPDNIFVLTQSALHGRLAGMMVTLGLCTGLVVHTTAVALGVAALIAASATAFSIVRTGGALYLCWLAWQAFRAASRPVSVAGETGLRPAASYARGVVMNLSNPKVVLFFLAFLPQFADPARGDVTVQIFVLGAVFIAATSLVFGSIAWFSGTVGEKLMKSPGAQKLLNRAAGTVLLALAANLAVAAWR